MADTNIDKIKEQCFELILSVMPLSQIAFVVLMSIVLDQLLSPVNFSVAGVVGHVGLKKIFDIGDGLAWHVNLLTVAAAFLLALINTWLLKKGLRKSFDVSKIHVRLNSWFQKAFESVSNIAPENLTPIHVSVSIELEKRIKKYHAKRLLCETALAIAACILYGSLFIIINSFHSNYHVIFSSFDFLVGIVAALSGFILHRSSVRYAISKVIPLQVYLSATNGQVVFFIDADS